jgi:hypothetical protein
LSRGTTDALQACVGSSSTPLHLTSGAAAERAPSPSNAGLAARRAPWILALLAGLAILALLLLRATSEERALTMLPPAERAAVYHRTLDNLRTVCAGERGHEIRDFCRGQAQLVLLLPECDGACQATAREQLRTPTR